MIKAHILNLNPQELLRGYNIRIKMYALLLEEYNRIISRGDINPQSYSQHVSSGHNSNSPIERYIHRLENITSVMNIIDLMNQPVRKLINNLNHDIIHGPFPNSLLLNILRLHFWQNRNIQSVSQHLGITAHTARDAVRYILRLTRTYANRSRKRINTHS